MPAAPRALSAVTLLLMGACSEEVAPVTVLLVTLDTTRADHLSTYGYARDTDPFLRSLAEDSLVFDVAVPSATWTLPSHVSMFSGLDPAEHGCWLHLEDAAEHGVMPTVSDSTMLLTERLANAGFHCLAAVGGPFASSRYGLLRDFDEFIDPADQWELSAAEINEWTLAALDRRPGDKPLFLFLNYFDAHAPYDAPADREYPFPEEPRELSAVGPLEHWDVASRGPIPDEVLRDARDQYDRELRVVDSALEEIFERLKSEGLLENALILITSDHGEMFGENGVYGHGCLPFEPVARVPLILHRTGGPRGRVATPVSLSSVAATLLFELELPLLPPGGGGVRYNLLDLPPTVDPPYTEHRGGERWFGVLRGERYKFGSPLELSTGLPLESTSVLSDLVDNPGEAPRPVAGSAAEEARLALRERLSDVTRSWQAPPSDTKGAKLGAEEAARLRDLGYGGD